MVELFGSFEPCARILLSLYTFTGVLCFLARVPKQELQTPAGVVMRRKVHYMFGGIMLFITIVILLIYVFNRG